MACTFHISRSYQDCYVNEHKLTCKIPIPQLYVSFTFTSTWPHLVAQLAKWRMKQPGSNPFQSCEYPFIDSSTYTRKSLRVSHTYKPTNIISFPLYIIRCFRHLFCQNPDQKSSSFLFKARQFNQPWLLAQLEQTLRPRTFLCRLESNSSFSSLPSRLHLSGLGVRGWFSRSHSRDIFN